MPALQPCIGFGRIQAGDLVRTHAAQGGKDLWADLRVRLTEL
jgi:hypothetical protein